MDEETQLNNELLASALAYVSRGLPVFPLKPRGKLPLTVRGFKDATTDPATVRAWWTRWPEANIGIPTGEASGWAVVDVDPRHGGDVSFERFDPPPTLVSITGGGGRHLIFKHVGGFRNSSGVIGAGIDTRGEGGYIVVPPSVHETGALYAWEGDGEETVLADLPDYFRPDHASRLPQLAAGNLDLTTGTPRANGQPVLPGGRNSAATSLAGQFVAQGDSVSSVLSKLRDWNATNPDPLPDPEVQKVAASVALTHVRNNPAAEVRVFDEPPPNLSQSPHSVTYPNFPPALLSPPGLIGEISSWINSTAIKPQPVLALANVLAFCGALFGRKVQSPTGLRTNFYCVTVSASGCGKEHSRRCIKNICKEAGVLDKLLGGEDISSDSSILGALYEHPSILFQWDEIGWMFSTMTSKYSQNHQKAVAPLLMKLFSSASTTLLGKEYAGRQEKRKDIDQPNLCVYGTTTQDRFNDPLTPREISDGFLGRFLIFKSDDPDPQERDDIEQVPVPASIIAAVQSWYQWTPPAPTSAGNITRATEVFPITASFEADAQSAFRAFRARCRTLKAETRGSGLDALWVRALEHATKVALAVATGEQFGGPPIVSGSTAEWAIALVDHLTSSFVRYVEDNMAGSDHERDLKKLRGVIDRAGSDGITKSDLIRKSQWLPRRKRDDLLADLLQSGDVINRENKPPRGPSAIFYYSTKTIQMKNN